MNGNVIRTITIRGQSEGLDKLTADINKLATAQQNVAIVAEDSAKRVLSLEEAWKRQTLRLDEAARAQSNIARETKLADAALREGLATQAQHAQRLEQINQRYVKTADATKVVTQQTGLASHELVNLGRQAQDVGVSLMSGQSPFTVLVQQGSQIADVFATSGGTLRGFFGQAFSWAKTFITSTTGIVTGVLAIGAAIAFAAVKWADAGKTIEEVLKEEQRLLKETKTLIDEKASLEAKAHAQSRDLTTFELKRNELRLQDKLNEAMRETADLVAKAATRPTAVAGEMGEAPTAVSASGLDPGFEKLAAAREELTAKMAAGLPGIEAFRSELGRIGELHPELALTVERLIAASAEGIKLEQAALRAKAMKDALAGIATDAQLAAVGLGSVAQFNLSNLGAKEAADATERMAQHTLALAASYPGMSVEVAKQLDALQGQLIIAQARTGAEQIVAQEYVTQNTLLAQGKTLEEAIAIAAAQRAVAEANVSKTISDQIHGLNQQIELSEARLNNTEEMVTAQQAYTNAIRQGASEFEAQALGQKTLDAANQRTHEQRVSAIEQEDNAISNLSGETSRNTQVTLRANQVYSDVTDSILDYSASIAFWAETMQEMIDKATDFGFDTEFKSEGYETYWDPMNLTGLKKNLEYVYGEENVEMKTMGLGFGTYQLPTLKTGAKSVAQTELEDAIAEMLDVDVDKLDVSTPAALEKSFLAVLQQGFEDGLSDVNRIIDIVADETEQASLIQEAIDYIKDKETPSLAREELIDELNDKLDDLADSTDSLNSTLQDALSPYYSQDPRTTKLGFRAGVVGNPDWLTGATNATALDAILGEGATAPGMASGGSFTVGGGYSANDNRMAVFPVASGEEVVVNRTPQGRGGQVVNIDNRIVIMGAVDADTLSKMKVTRYQQSQRMRAGLVRA